MPPGEVPVTCSACGNQLRVPFAAVKRDNTYCSQCGHKVSLAGAFNNNDNNPTAGPARKPARRPYRPVRGRR